VEGLSPSVVGSQVQGEITRIADLYEEYQRAHPEQLGKLEERNLNKCVLKKGDPRTRSLI
jgi:hypothetical protein